MKKDYVKPYIETINSEIGENILQSSYVDIGGNTDTFNAPRRDSFMILNDSEEE